MFDTLIKLIFLCLAINSVVGLNFTKYHSNKELEDFLKNFTHSPKSDFLSTRLYSIGKSVKYNPLWVLEITADKSKKVAVPNIKLIGTIHGNEPVGREMLLHFLEYLRGNYKKNSTIRWLLDNTKIHILPNLNPDGFAQSSEDMCIGEEGRTNSINIDLNRNFPDFYHKNNIPEALETRAVKKWMKDIPFILSAGLHGGALVANYPFDTVKQPVTSETRVVSPTPDDDVFKHLATVYAQSHPTMHKGISCDDSTDKFEGGITNGAAWYFFAGSMQDYNYMQGCMEVTLEISCCKYPNAEELPQLWDQNKFALVNYCIQAHRGVTGQIFDAISKKPIAGAVLKILGRNIEFKSFENGNFWRILLPNNYSLQISAHGYHKKIQHFIVEDYKNSLPRLTELKIYLINSSFPSTTTTARTVTVSSTKFKIRAIDGDKTTKINLFNKSKHEISTKSTVNKAETGFLIENRAPLKEVFGIFILIIYWKLLILLR